MTETAARNPAGPPRRFALLDFSRFIAALAVVGYHFTVYPYDWGWGRPPVEVFGALTKITGYGYLGVYLFFIISGFVITMSVRGRSVGAFVASRVARLLPAYWVVVVLSAAVFVPLLTGRLGFAEIRVAVVNMTMLQVPFGVPHVDGVYWTLWVELCFYIIVGVLMLTGVTYGKLLAMTLLWPLAAVLLAEGDGILVELFQPAFAPLFAGGIGIYLIHAYGHSLTHWFAVGVNAILSANLASQSVAPVRASVDADLSSAVAFALVIGCFALVACAVLTPLHGLTGRVGVALGRLTYPLYLVHVFPGLLVISWTHEALGAWPSLILAVSVATGLALLINRFVEQRVSRPLRTRLESELGRDRRGERRGAEQSAVGSAQE